MSEKSPKHVSDLSGIFTELKAGVIMYGFDPAINADKQLPMNLFLSEINTIKSRLDELEGIAASATINIHDFTISHLAGFNDISRNLVFTASINPNIMEGNFNILTISYDGTIVNLLDPNTLAFIDGVKLTSGVLEIDVPASFETTWTTNTTFTLSIEIDNGSPSEYAEKQFLAIPKITLGTNSITNVFTTNDTEDITVKCILGSYTVNALNVVTGLITYGDGLTPSQSIPISSSIDYTYSLEDLLIYLNPTNTVLTTVTITQTVGSDPIHSVSFTESLLPAYRPITFVNNLSIVPTGIVVNTPTDVIFGALVSRSLKHSTITITGSDLTVVTFAEGSELTTTFSEELNLVISTVGTVTYTMTINETNLATDDPWPPLISSTVTLTVGTQLGDPFYWGAFITGTTYIEADLVAYVQSLGIVDDTNLWLDTYNGAGEAATRTFLYGDQFPFGAQYGYYWVAIPTSKHPNGFYWTYPVSSYNHADDNKVSERMWNTAIQLTINGVATDYILSINKVRESTTNRIFEIN